MATYQSISTTTVTNIASLVITKPSGLAVGDYMFAQVVAEGTAFSTPSGWTALYNAGTSMSGSTIPCAVFYKQADSADVAASNFSFGNGVTNRKSGSLMRVSNFGIIDDSASPTTSLSAGSPQVEASTIDPVFANNLALAFLFGGDNAANTMTITGFSIATDNPTWTQRFSDTYSGAGASYIMATYTASRTQDTAWGNASMSFTQSGSGIGTLMVLASLAPQINGSHAVTTAPMYVVNHPFLRTGALTLQGNDPATDSFSQTDWQNEATGSTAWTNESL